MRLDFLNKTGMSPNSWQKGLILGVFKNFSQPNPFIWAPENLWAFVSTTIVGIIKEGSITVSFLISQSVLSNPLKA